MQVALTVWEGRISPLFDSAHMLLVADVQGGHRIVAKRYEFIECESAFDRAAKLNDLGVSVLMCGGISESFANLIEARGIKIIPFLYGDADEVLDAWLTDGCCTPRD